MLVIGVSVTAAVTQMALLLLMARLIGVVEYSRFSLLMTISLFLATVASEWLRMTLARYAGMKKARTRDAFLAAIRRSTLYLTLAALAFGCGCGLVIAAFGHYQTAVWLGTLGFLASAAILSDIQATYFRFASSPRVYAQYIFLRVISAGGAACLSAMLGFGAVVSALFFGLATLALAAIFRQVAWPAGRIQHSRLILRKSAPVGWSMATSSITMNFIAAASRSAMQICFSPEIAGSIFLALDTAVRGLIVLGTALSTWGSRMLYDAAHMGGVARTKQIFPDLAMVFLHIWFSIGIYGAATASAIPAIVSPTPLDTTYIVSAACNIVAFFVIFVRLFLVDPFMAALGKEREIAIASAAAFASGALAATASVALLSTTLAMTTAAIAVVTSVAVYLARNASALRGMLSGGTQRYMALKLGLSGGALLSWFFFSNPALTVGIAALALLSDLVALRGVVAVFQKILVQESGHALVTRRFTESSTK